MGGLRPVQPSLSPSRREVLGQPPQWAPVPLRPTSSSPSLKPCRCQNSDSNTGSDTTPNTRGALRAETGLKLDMPQRTHTQTTVRWGDGGSQSLTQGEGLVGGLARAHFHLLLTTRL